MALEPRYGLARLFRLAGEKDRGFTPAVFAEMLARVSRLRRGEFDVDDLRYRELVDVVARWRAEALAIASRPTE
jgi:hypothetical protein